MSYVGIRLNNIFIQKGGDDKNVYLPKVSRMFC